MTPFGGLSMLIHLLILSLQHKRKVLFSLVIILAVWGVLTVGTLHSIKALLGENSNIYYLLDRFEQCEPIQTSDGENKVVLRVDDIQAFAWRETTIKMVDEALANNMPMVLGVIPAKLQEDPIMSKYLKRNHCKIEISQHGWDHQSEPPEFTNLDEDAAYQRIIKGKAILQEITDFPIVTFIPPHNTYSEGTKKALERAGFLIISSEGSGVFDYTTSTYDSSKSALNPVSEVIDQCQEGLNKNNLCVVMLHPQDYTTNDQLDEEKYKKYSELLVELKKLNVSFVQMKDVIE